MTFSNNLEEIKPDDDDEDLDVIIRKPVKEE